MRELILSADQIHRLQLAGVRAALKRAKFRLLPTDPPKLAEPARVERDEEGRTVFRQWDSQGAMETEFETEKITALKSLDVDKIVAFRRKWRLPCPDVDTEFYLIGAHRFRMHCAALTPEERNYSAHWLIRQGFSTNKDEVYLRPPVVTVQ